MRGIQVKKGIHGIQVVRVIYGIQVIRKARDQLVTEAAMIVVFNLAFVADSQSKAFRAKDQVHQTVQDQHAVVEGNGGIAVVVL